MAKHQLLVVLLLWCLLALLAGGSPQGQRRRSRQLLLRRPPSTTQSQCKYTLHYFTQTLNHSDPGDKRTFQQRYLVYDEEWLNTKEGPILLYTGNEGDIVWFCNNTGFIFDLASELAGMVVFIEHRYYGDSLPFGDTSFQNKTSLAFLTSEQALADFALLMTNLKDSVYKTSVPVVAIGGSYGGMLAAWMRMKYPHVVVGALAASAPIWWFTGITPCNSASVTITTVFDQATPSGSMHSCSTVIQKSWKALDNAAKKSGGLQWLSDTFKLCKPLKSNSHYEGFVDWLSETWFNLAMANYPFNDTFLEPLPPWPIKITCQFLSKPFQSDEELLQMVASSLEVYYNYTGYTKCFDTGQNAVSTLGEKGWDYQACTEMIMPMCSDGVHDMFPVSPWNLTAYGEDCKAKYGVTIQPYLIESLYGGKNISSHSNIIFSNGLLDPWHGGGVLHNVSDTLPALILPNGAHHLDLQGSRSIDPQELTDFRRSEKEIIQSWVTQYNK